MSRTSPKTLIVRHLGRRDYLPTWEAMRAFTDARTATTPSELWIVEHPAVFTQGQAGKAEHLLAPGDIPVVQTDRGGQVTYHGPGQLVVYLLVSLRDVGVGIRGLVSIIEQAIIDLLGARGIEAQARPDAPGVYVDGRKIASLGLRVRRGFTYHGLALNVSNDLEPFRRINPCGHAGLEVTSTRQLGIGDDTDVLAQELSQRLADALGLHISDG
ncbi:MAG: lipoyl(octanoyl) transferase LipB [Gammaproteobacteria bacterium]|nr:lipoyl(octanoyl) transferase LipB [Gammaproteobacteria bacterium]HOP15401.1 lipoyl(octanoyl) transferase LipB [Gammaproteobacteria bacterium]